MIVQHANPGGVLAPEEVVGRDRLVAQLWRVLDRRSLYITAERRMGKTSIVRDKMGKAPPAGWTLIYLDVSRAASPLQFIEALYEAAKPQLSTGKRAKLAFSESVRALAGTSFTAAGVSLKLPDRLGADWKVLLTSLLHDLTQLDTRVVLALDEFPLMLDAVKRRENSLTGQQTVMELLDTLRACREELNLRMIYTGSLGLHHVLTDLRGQGYQNDPTNNMHSVDLDPLTQEDAEELVRRLLAGEHVPCDDVDAVAAHLAQATSGIAFYIQHVVASLVDGDLPGTVDEIDRCMKARLSDSLDPWHLNYYDERIDTHYPPAYRPISRAVLDHLAMGTARTLEDLTASIDPAQIERDPETVRRVLRLLGQDHYITSDEGMYRFRNPFMQRIWKSRRGKEE